MTSAVRRGKVKRTGWSGPPLPAGVLRVVRAEWRMVLRLAGGRERKVWQAAASSTTRCRRPTSSTLSTRLLPAR